MSQTLNWGIGRHCDVEWTSYCLRAHETWFVEVQMQFLEICSDLVSHVQHHRFEGHFEFLNENPVSEEWGDHGAECECVVVCKLGQGKEVDPIFLLVVDVHL